MKCDDNSSPTNSRINVALHKTGYGNVYFCYCWATEAYTGQTYFRTYLMPPKEQSSDSLFRTDIVIIVPTITL